MKLNMKKIDLVGRRFNRLLVISECKERTRNNKIVWECLCDCGNTLNVIGSDMKSGRTKSCGCLHSEMTTERNKKGLSEEVRQKISKSRKGKCLGKNNPAYREDVKQKHRERMVGNNLGFKHGQSYTKQYKAQANSKRRTMKLNQTLELTNRELEKIDLYYQISNYLGPGWEVDHIIPISKGGSGHPDNLQIITKEENRKKYNSLDYEVEYSFRI